MNASTHELLRALDSVEVFEAMLKRTQRDATVYAARNERRQRRRERLNSPRVMAQNAFQAEAR